MTTGGTYALGLGANNGIASGTPKLVLTVTSPGYDDAGNATTISRTVYGTTPVRFPYPSNAYKDETEIGTNVRVTIGLSEFVHYGDTVKADILAGLYNQGSASNGTAYSVTATNTSVVTYAQPIANWSWPGFWRITNNTFELRCVAFHRNAQQGRPLRAVKFWATDEHSNSVTSIVTSATIDTNMGDAVPVIEYVATLSSTGFAQGDKITCNFIAYPWVGDANAPLSTADGKYTRPTGGYAPLELLCDRTGAYGVTYAWVDPATGNDTTGYATNVWSTNALPCLSINGAAHRIMIWNSNNLSRADCGAGVIYLAATNNHFWTRGNLSAGSTPKTWVTVMPLPGLGSNDVGIRTDSTTRDLSDRVKVQGVTLGYTNAGTAQCFAGISELWFDRVVINGGTSGGFVRLTNSYVTHSLLQTNLQGIGPHATDKSYVSLVRGCNLSWATGPVMAWTIIGNTHTNEPQNNNIQAIREFISGGGYEPIDGLIIGYNKFMAYGRTNTGISWASIMGNHAKTNGVAFVQNIVEPLGQYTASAFYFHGDGSLVMASNAIVWHNTLLGQKFNYGYNDSGTNPIWQYNWSVKNNWFDDVNTKSDTFPTASGNRIGNWPITFGVAHRGNVIGEIYNVGSPGTFTNEFVGIDCDAPGSGTRTNIYPAFTLRGSWDGFTYGSGNGDYTLLTNSPLIGMAKEWLLPYDISGRARTSGGASGAYEY